MEVVKFVKPKEAGLEGSQIILTDGDKNIKVTADYPANYDFDSGYHRVVQECSDKKGNRYWIYWHIKDDFDCQHGSIEDACDWLEPYMVETIE